MPHEWPPEDDRSPASPYAPHQPAAGVVAGDRDEEDLPKGAVRAKDWKPPKGEEEEAKQPAPAPAKEQPAKHEAKADKRE